MKRLLWVCSMSMLPCLAGLGLGATYNTPVDLDLYLTGTRTVGAGLAGLGSWADGEPDMSLSWLISVNLDGSFHYQYTFAAIEGMPSHAIFEVSEACPAQELPCVANADVDGDTAILDYAVFSGDDPSNPGMPAPIYGVMMDNEGLMYSFNSIRIPVWGDFYAAGGETQGAGPNAAWNTGLTNHGSTSVLDFIPRPDTQFSDAPTVPEPATMGLIGCGMLLLGLRRLRGFRIAHDPALGSKL